MERPPLGTAHAAEIRQRGWIACAESGQTAVGAAEAVPVLGGKLPEVTAVLPRCWLTSRRRPCCASRALGWLGTDARDLGRWVAHQPVTAQYSFSLKNQLRESRLRRPCMNLKACSTGPIITAISPESKEPKGTYKKTGADTYFTQDRTLQHSNAIIIQSATRARPESTPE